MKAKKLQRAIGIILTLAMCLSLLPAAVFAAVVTDAQDVNIIGLSVSGAAWGGWRSYVTAFLKEMDDGFDSTAIWGAIVSTEDDQPFYFNGAGLHRVTLYTSYETDPSKIEVYGANLAKPFTSQRVGEARSEDGGGLYLLQGEVGFWSVNEAPVEFMYDGTKLAGLTALSADELTEERPYIGEIHVVDRTDYGALLVQISGINLQSGSSAIGHLTIADDEGNALYACRGVESADENTGVYTYIMAPTGNETEQNSWYKLYWDNDILSFLGNGYEVATIPAFGALSGSGGGDTPKPEKPSVTLPATTSSRTVNASISAAGYVNGTVGYSVSDSDGNVVASGSEAKITSASMSLPITLPENYGIYTINFKFSSQDGGSVEDLRDFTVTYKNDSHADPTSAGIRELTKAGTGSWTDSGEAAQDADGVYVLNVADAISYRFYAVAPEYEPLEIVFYAQDGSMLKSEDMSWSGGAKRYEKEYSAQTIKGAASVDFRVKAEPSLKLTLEIDELAGAYISVAYDPRVDAQYHTAKKKVVKPKVTYSFSTGGGIVYPPMVNDFAQDEDDGTVTGGMSEGGLWTTPSEYYTVKPGAKISCSFVSEVGDEWTPQVVLTYKDTSGGEKTVTEECTLNTKRNEYEAVLIVPDDVMNLVSVEYQMLNSHGLASSRKNFDMSNYYSCGIILFDDIPTEYYNTTITVTGGSEEKGYTNIHTVVDYDKNDGYKRIASLGGLLPGTYDYEITGASGHIAGGKLTVTGDAEQHISFGEGGLNLPKLHILEIYKGMEAGAEGAVPVSSCIVEITTPDGQTHTVTNAPSWVQQIPAGSTIHISLDYAGINNNNISGYTVGKNDFTLDGSTIVHITFQAFEKREITGTLVNADSGKPVSFARVSLVQNITRTDGSAFTYRTSVLSDEDGVFTFPQAYSGFGGTVEVRAATYAYAEKTFAAGADAGEISLTYQGSLIIMPRLMIEPAKLVDKNGDALTDEDGNEIGNEIGDTLLTGDSSLISVDYILIDGKKYERDKDWDETVIAGESYIYMRDEENLSALLNEGKEITVCLNQKADEPFEMMGRKMALRSQDITVTLDAGRNAVASAAAYRIGGEIRATVAEPNEDGMVGFLVLAKPGINMWPNEDKTSSYEYRIDKWTYGTGELSIAYEAPEYQSYEAYGFKVREDDVALINQMLKNGRPYLYDMVHNSPDTVAVSGISNIADNRYVVLKDMEPKKDYLNVLLGPWSFDYTITPYSQDMSYAVVRGTLTKRDPDTPDENILTQLSFSIDEGNPMFLVDGASCNADGIWYNRTASGKGYKDITSCSVYTLIPLNEANEVNFTLNVGYQLRRGLANKYENFNISEKLELFAIEVPETVYIEDEREMATTKKQVNDTIVWTNWALCASMRAYISEDERENTVTIWDNGVPVDKFHLYYAEGWGPYRDGRTGYIDSMGFELVDKDTPGVHTIWATREKKNSDGEYETISTEKKTVRCVSGGNVIYASEIHWYHHNDKGIQDMYFPTLSSFSGKTIRIWPSKNSIMTFRINNALSTDFTYVYLKVEGGKTYQAECYYDDVGRNRSYWIVYKKGNLDVGALKSSDPSVLVSSAVKEQVDKNGLSFGTVEGLEVVMNLVTPIVETPDREVLREQSLREYYELLGMQVPDFDDNLEKIATATDEEIAAYLEEDKETTPDELNELVYTEEVSEDGKTYTYTATPTDSVASSVSTINIGDDTEYSLYQLYTRMDQERSDGYTPEEGEGFDIYWSHYETVQGMAVERMAVKREEVVKDGKKQYHEVMHNEIYLPAEVADALMDTVSPAKTQKKAAASVSLMAADNKTKAKVNEEGDPLLKKAFDIVNDTFTVVDFHNSYYVKQMVDAAKTLGVTNKEVLKLLEDNTSFINSKVGNTMGILNVIDYAYTVSKGPSGASGDDLWEALSHIQDPNARASIAKDILDYQELRAANFERDCKVKAVTTAGGATGIFTLPVKIGLFVGGKTYDTINGYAQDYQKNTYETIARDIQNQIKLDAYRAKNKAEIDQATKEFRERIRKSLSYFNGYVSEKAIDHEIATYWILVRENGEYKYKLKSKYQIKSTAPKFNVYIDPSGYVFEAIENNRIGGITASSYIGNGDGSFSLWEDPNTDAIERQDNPQITDNDTGRYGWMVPKGEWKVRFEDENGIYRSTESKSMIVPPEHTAVNIGLLSKEAPKASVQVEENRITVNFSKYMQLESLITTGTVTDIVTDYDGNETTLEKTSYITDDVFDISQFAISFYDAAGKPIPGKITFPDKVENTGYTKDAVYQTDLIDSKYFVKTAVFTPEYENVDLTGVESVLSNKMVSYAGVALDTEATVNLYQITFDANGGTFSTSAAVTGEDGKLSSLMKPSRKDYTFLGWFTEAEGGTEVTTDTVFDKNTTVFAHWTKENTGGDDSGHNGGHGGSSGSYGSATKYTISAEKAANGSVSLSPTSATKGSTVTITVTPDEGYKLGSLMVTDTNGKEIAITEKNGKYTFTMPAGKVDVTPVFVKDDSEPTTPPTDPTTPPADNDNPFTDVATGDYFYDAVIWAAKEEITSGTTNTTFSPNDSCTRAQTVTFLWRAAGSPEPTTNVNPFTDVKTGDYFYKAVLWAYENGITLGTADDKFSPNDTVTRGQTVTFLYRSAGEKTNGENPFTDVMTGDYYYDSVLWAYENGITSGTSDTTFSPKDDCLRGQIVTFLYRYYK